MNSEVENNLLKNSSLCREDLEKTLAFIHQHNVDYADLYFQSSYHESWMLEDGLVKEGSYNIERGVGVRAVSGDKTGFSYSLFLLSITINPFKILYISRRKYSCCRI